VISSGLLLFSYQPIFVASGQCDLQSVSQSQWPCHGAPWQVVTAGARSDARPKLRVFSCPLRIVVWSVWFISGRLCTQPCSLLEFMACHSGRGSEGRLLQPASQRQPPGGAQAASGDPHGVVVWAWEYVCMLTHDA